MKQRVRFSIEAEDYLLAQACAADRGLQVSDLARGALMAEVRRYAGRSHVVDQLMERIMQNGEAVFQRVIRPHLESFLDQWTENALAVPSALAEREGDAR